MVLYADENTDARLVRALRAHGHAVHTAQDMALTGADDEQQLAAAGEHGWVLLTSDAGFLVLAHERAIAGREHPGIIFVRQGRLGIGQTVRLANAALSLAAGRTTGRVLFA